MPNGPPQGPPSREEARQAGAKRWDAIRAAQAKVQQEAAKNNETPRRRAGEFPGRRSLRSVQPRSFDIKNLAQNRLKRI